MLDSAPLLTSKPPHNFLCVLSSRPGSLASCPQLNCKLVTATSRGGLKAAPGWKEVSVLSPPATGETLLPSVSLGFSLVVVLQLLS